MAAVWVGQKSYGWIRQRALMAVGQWGLMVLAVVTGAYSLRGQVSSVVMSSERSMPTAAEEAEEKHNKSGCLQI